MIHLDTGFLIRALVRNSSEDNKLRTWLRSDTQLGMSAIAWGEFLCGPVEKSDIARPEAIRQLVNAQARPNFPPERFGRRQLNACKRIGETVEVSRVVQVRHPPQR